MKKSEVYRLAMVAVAESESLRSEQMVEIIEVLSDDRKLAKWSEEKEEQHESV